MSEPEFAYRIRDAFIELEPGETQVWQLPPFTPGSIFVSANYAEPGSIINEGGGGAGSGSGSGFGGGIARYRPPFGPGAGDFDLDTDGGGGGSGGGTGPAMDLTVRLLCGAEEPHAERSLGHLTVDAHTFAASDQWMLQIERGTDGAIGKRRYRIRVQYPSVLPIEMRRIPASFFARSFDKNWNDNPYLDYARIRNDRIAYRWYQQYAEAYHKPQGDQYFELPYSDYYSLPEIYMESIEVSVGGEVWPWVSPTQSPSAPTPTPYLKLKLKCQYAHSRTVEIENYGPNLSFDLPKDLWFEVKLFIGTGGDQNSPGLYYAPWVSSPLLNMLNFDITYLTPSGRETFNPKDELKRSIEKHISDLQIDPETGGNMVNDYVRPYIVGHYDLYGLGWDAEKEDVLVYYVGKQTPPHARTNLDRNRNRGRGDGSVGGPGGAGGTLSGADGERTIGEDGPFSGPRPLLFDTPGEMPLSPAEPPRTVDVTPGNLSKIDRIVVLMQENRSFDHILGYLSRDGMLPRAEMLAGEDPEHLKQREAIQAQVDGLLQGENLRDVNKHNNVKYRSTRRFKTSWPSYTLPGPYHGAHAVAGQVSFEMGGFVNEWASHALAVNYYPDPEEPEDPTGKHPLQLVMDYLTDAELPAFGALTREFAICDRWHCSHLGGTLPNRFISLTGDFSRDIYGTPEIENPELKGFAPLEEPTFFDHLTAHGVEWKLFEHGYSTLRLVRNYTFDEKNILSFADDFEAMVKSPQGLPPVTFIEPDYIEATGGANNDDHAPADMINGQRLIAKIMDALLSDENKDRWANTLFIITYDEHGGFYDHVVPPTHVETTNPDGSVTQTPIPPLSVGEPRLGVRVPAFVISPWIPGADAEGQVNVSHILFDHTSIPATILRRFCGPKAPFMGDRWGAANDVGVLLTLDAPRPYSDFEQLGNEMAVIRAKSAARLTGDTSAMLKPPLRKPKTIEDLEENFSGLMAFASSISGRGR